MATKYSDAYIRSVAEGSVTAPNSYVSRLARGYQRGFTRSQARGHARTTKGETFISKVVGTRGSRGSRDVPKITQRVQHLPNGTKVVHTKSASVIGSELDRKTKGIGSGNLNRVYFQVYDPSTGKWKDVYKGKEGKKGFHGIAVEELNRRIEMKMDSTGVDFDTALWDVLDEDSDGYMDGGDSGTPSFPTGGFSQVRMYVR